MALCYGWDPQDLPSHCACCEVFNTCHALSCALGSFIISCHNELRDLTADLLLEVCNDVEVEPRLQPVSAHHVLPTSANRSDEARLDVKACGLWGGRFERAFFDVRVFSPSAISNQTSTLTAAFRKQELSKRRTYEQRVRDVEMASFTPLVFAATGGAGPAAATTFKRIAGLLSEKWSLPYSAVISWIRCKLSFALIRASIMCLRGSR